MEKKRITRKERFSELRKNMAKEGERVKEILEKYEESRKHHGSKRCKRVL